MQCILCEKPSAAKNYATALGGMRGTFNGKQYEIVNSVGHIFSFLPDEKQVIPELSEKYKSWDLENLPWNLDEIAFRKALNSKFKDTFDKIKNVAERCDEFVIATDDDPTGEGTLLANEIIEALRLKDVHYYRSFHVDESPKEIQKAMTNLKDLGFNPKTDPDYIKSDFRSKWDFLSIKWTRIFTKLSDNGFSVLRQGRLKSYMVWAVGEQIRLVNEYKKVPYYQNRFKDENDNIYSSKNEEQYKKKEDVPNKYKNSEVVIDGEETKYKAPPALYDLNMLSASLAPKGFTSKQVLDVYQKMYENHIVSYPRTEDKTITPEQFNEFLAIADKVADVVGVDKTLLCNRSPRKTHVVASGSHGANRPSKNVPNSLDEIKKNYGECGSLIYQFVARNSLAMLCEDYEYIHQTGHVKDYPDFIGSTNIPINLGYKKIFNDEKDENYKELGKTATPFIYEGFPPKPVWPTAKWLANLLKKNDVGTGATRASIYGDVTDPKAKYPLLTDKKGKIDMTTYGAMSHTLLKGTHIADVKLTEKLQAQMREVAKGADAQEFLKQVSSLVTDDIEIVKKNSKTIIQEAPKCVCPICGSPLKEINMGFVCSKNNKQDNACTFVIWKNTYGANLTNKEIEEIINSKRTSEPVNLTSKAGKKYKAHLKLENGKVVPEFAEPEKFPVPCPSCGKELTSNFNTIFCSKDKGGCGFIVYKDIAGVRISDEEFKELFAYGQTKKISGFKSKTKRKFSARLVLDSNNKITFGK